MSGSALIGARCNMSRASRANRPSRLQAVFNGMVDGLRPRHVGAGRLGHALRRPIRWGRGLRPRRDPLQGFDGQAAWRVSPNGRFTLQGIADTGALRAIGAPVGKGLPPRAPIRLTLTQVGAAWTGALDADAYSGSLTLSGGGERPPALRGRPDSCRGPEDWADPARGSRTLDPAGGGRRHERRRGRPGLYGGGPGSAR